MILVGIDVAKDKHDCFIQTAEGKVLHKAFSFVNNYEGFEELYALKLQRFWDKSRARSAGALFLQSSRLFTQQRTCDFRFQSSSNQSIP